MSKMKWHALKKCKARTIASHIKNPKPNIKYKTYITNTNIFVYYNQNPKPNKSIKPNQNKKIWVPN